MTKAERLIFLSNLITNRGPVSVEELASESDVSPRTIYRDINSLSRMNIPVYYDNGYRMTRDGTNFGAALSSDDVDLICYALRCNPLVISPFLKKKFAVIEQLLRAKAKKGKEREVSLFLFEKRGLPRLSPHEIQICSRFVEAALERRKVRLYTRGRGEPRELVLPVSVRCRGEQLYLVKAADLNAPLEEVGIPMITKLEISDERFPVRPVALLRLHTSPLKSRP